MTCKAQSSFDIGVFYAPFIPLMTSSGIVVRKPEIEQSSEEGYIFILRYENCLHHAFTPEVLAAFDWVLENIEPKDRLISHYYTHDDLRYHNVCEGIKIEFADMTKAALFKLMFL